MSAHKKMSETKNTLTQMGHIVEMPNLDNIDKQVDKDGNSLETAQIKIENDLIRGYFKKIQESDVVLVVNEDKKKTKGYIGANSFLELGFGYVLGKKIFLLNNYTKKLSCSDEITAMEPIILNGDLDKINQYL
jgi:nucleoside 2-deoxyribosyltransferase